MVAPSYSAVVGARLDLALLGRHKMLFTDFRHVLISE